MARPKKTTLAEKADVHELYEAAVQCVEAEIDMIDESYTAIRGKRAHKLREDFGGTGNTSCEWVRRREENTATVVDIDSDVLAWGAEHHFAKLDPNQQQRIEQRCCDVMTCDVAAADIVVAMNFSFQLYKTRDQLRAYFASVHKTLADDGVMFIDAFGGHESWKSLKEKTKYDGFTYVWQQKRYDPISADIDCRIHFKFADGSKIKNAFRYEWRLWTIPELRELLEEAGFSQVIVYWEGTDEESGEGNGIYTPAKAGEDDPSWVIYIAGVK